MRLSSPLPAISLAASLLVLPSFACSSDDASSAPDGAPDAPAETGGGLDGAVESSLMDNSLSDGATVDVSTGDAPLPDAGKVDSSDSGDGQASVDSNIDSPVEAGGTPTWHLWVLEATHQRLYGYAPAQLAATNGDVPEIDIALADLPGNQIVDSKLQFDGHGDLWLSLLDAYRFPASALLASGTAHVAAALANYGGNYGNLAFDAAGNLWRSTYAAIPLSRYDAADLATLTPTVKSLTPKLTITSASSYPVVFDAAGNLYTGAYATEGSTTSPNYVARYGAAQLAGTGTVADPPAMTLKPVVSATGMAMTSTGDIFVVDASTTIRRYSKTQVSRSGTALDEPAETNITVTGVTTLSPTRVALDPQGNLYLAENSTRVVKLAASDLAQKGTLSIAASMTLRAPADKADARFQATAVH